MTTTPDSTTFYVYALARPSKKEWRIFYIGKGKKNRVFNHEWEAKSGHRCYKCNVIRKVWRNGGEIQRYILLTTENEDEAFNYEKEMIALHGRKNLVNLTDGGEGGSGRVYVASKAAGRKISEAHRKRLADPENRRKHIERFEKMRNDPVARAKKSETMRAYFASPEGQAKASARGKRAWNSPEYRARQQAIRDAFLADKERVARRSESVRTALSKPENQERRRQGIRAFWENPENRTQQRAARQAAWDRRRAALKPGESTMSDETREKLREINKGRKLSADAQRKQIDAVSKTYYVVSPSGDEQIIKNMKDFCRKNGLTATAMGRVAKGRGRHHKGWTCREWKE